jgi:hypothetical protein
VLACEGSTARLAGVPASFLVLGHCPSRQGAKAGLPVGESRGFSGSTAGLDIILDSIHRGQGLGRFADSAARHVASWRAAGCKLGSAGCGELGKCVELDCRKASRCTDLRGEAD